MKAVNIKTNQVQTVLSDLKQAVIVDYDLQVNIKTQETSHVSE